MVWQGLHIKGSRSCKIYNSQENSKLLYGLEEWKMEDWVDLFMTQGANLSL
jgi:hypothetical protein